MPANVNTFIHATGTASAWHGLGHIVDANASIETWMEECKLDYRVVRKNIWMEENQSKMKIDGFVAIVRSTDGTVFQIASNKYKPVQNSEILQLMKEYTESHEMTLDTMGSLGEMGQIVWGLAKLNFEFDLPGGDKMVAYLLLASSHDGSIQWSGMITFVRVVCQNTLFAAISEKNSRGKNLFSKKHTKHLDVKKVVEDARKEIELIRKSAQRFQDQVTVLAETKLSPVDAQLLTAKLTNNQELIAEIEDVQKKANANLLTAIIAKTQLKAGSYDSLFEDNQTRVGKSILDAMVNSPGSSLESANGTLWGWINGVTYFTDHQSGSDENRMKSSWFGPNSNLKDKAMELATEYVAMKAS